MPNSLDENLKSLRVLHQILILLALAIFVFARSPDLSNECKNALAELSDVHEFERSWDEYRYFVYDRFKDSKPNDTDYFIQVVREAGASIYGSPHVTQPFLLDRGIGAGTLADEEAFIVERHTFQWVKFRRSKDFADTAVTQLKARLTTSHRPGLSAVHVDAPGYGSPNGDLLAIERRGPPGNQTATINFVFLDLSYPPPYPQGPVVPVGIEYDLYPEHAGQFGMEWLQSQTVGQRLVDSKTGIVFPHLKKFWSSVANMGSGDAAVVLQQKLDSLKGSTISFFGIPVETSLAVWIGPLVSFFVVLAFLLHCRQFRSLRDKTEIVDRYPWIPLFSDRWSRFVTFLSIVGFPSIANACLLLRHGTLQDWSTWAGIVAAVFCLIASLWAWIVVLQFRSSNSIQE